MRIAIFTNNFSPRLSGVSVAVNFLNTALTNLGHETLVIAPDYGYGQKIKGVEVFRVRSVYLRPKKMSLPLSRFDESAIREVVDQWKPDLIHSHHPFLLGKAAVDMAGEFNLPLVYTFHTLYEFFTHYFMIDTDAAKRAVREYVIRYTDHCDLVISPTDPIREYLVSIGVTTRTHTVPTGIDFSRFNQVTDERVSALKEKYGLDRFDSVLLYVGRISKEKGVHLCMQALKELVELGKNHALLMIGDGPEIKALESEAQQLGVTDRVVWGGFLDQDTLAAAYFLGDIFLFPSPSDTQGIVIYEARAAGLPVVAIDSMASRAAVIPGKTGLFAADDPADFAAKTQAILDDPDRFSERFDASAFSHQTLGETYERLYRETLETGKKPDPHQAKKLSRLIDEIKSIIKAED